MDSAVLPASEPVSKSARPHLAAFAWSKETARIKGSKGGKTTKQRRQSNTVDALQTLQRSYEASELKAMRDEITLTRKQLRTETDPDLRFKLGCLLKKLWEIYQLLANRPGPGTLKPRQDKPSGRRQASDVTIEYD